MVSVFPFRRQHRLIDSQFFQGLTDWHCHVLPGVDDGVQKLEESLAVLQEYEQLGISEVWLTPHIMEDIPNTTGQLREAFKTLQTRKNSGVELHLASENMMDNTLHVRLAENDLLPIGKANSSLLVETSYYTAPFKFYETLEKIANQGYQPVLAHPERYVYMEDADYQQLKETGVLFQLNLLSLGGHYGNLAKKKALQLLRQSYYDVVGSDLHNIENINWMKQLKLSSHLFAELETIKYQEL